MILWRGHCSVHGRFTVDAVETARREIPGVKVIVHPECRHEVVTRADLVGSTEFIIRTDGGADLAVVQTNELGLVPEAFGSLKPESYFRSGSASPLGWVTGRPRSPRPRRCPCRSSRRRSELPSLTKG